MTRHADARSAKEWVKWALFPGLDLMTRSRYRILPTFFRAGAIDTLDAGCGNGALSYAAYKLGNRVLGVTNNPIEVLKARALFSAIGVSGDRLQFELLDLYNLPKLGLQFDQIICSETLEHIKQDHLIIRYFYDALRPNGVLHLCCPYALHPMNRLDRVDLPEDGGHVRDGYTPSSYTALLQPAGFKIAATSGLGGPFLSKLDAFVRFFRNKMGDFAALPAFLLTWPLQSFDRPNPRLPLSLYVKAVKRAGLHP